MVHHLNQLLNDGPGLRWQIPANPAADGHIPWIDLALDDLPLRIGTPFYCSNDNVHTTPVGARLNAECVAAGLNKLNLLPV